VGNLAPVGICTLCIFISYEYALYSDGDNKLPQSFNQVNEELYSDCLNEPLLFSKILKSDTL